jgi:hypothetical protein
MAITKRTEEDKIEIIGQFKQIQVRTATIIEEDGTEISRTFSRHIVSPGADVSGESAEVQAIAAAVHTDAVVTAWNEKVLADTPSVEE